MLIKKHKVEGICIVPLLQYTQGIRYGSHSFIRKLHYICLYLVSVHQTAPLLIMVVDI